MVADRIKAMREQQGMTRTELAKSWALRAPG